MIIIIIIIIILITIIVTFTSSKDILFTIDISTATMIRFILTVY